MPALRVQIAQVDQQPQKANDAKESETGANVGSTTEKTEKAAVPKPKRISMQMSIGPTRSQRGSDVITPPELFYSRGKAGRPYEVASFAASKTGEPGWKRYGHDNEDSFVQICYGNICVFAVFDGHGGPSVSVRAMNVFVSKMTDRVVSTDKGTTTVKSFFAGGRTLSESSVKEFIANVADIVRDSDVGCTVSGLFVNLDNGEIFTFNAGDARTLIFSLQPEDSEFHGFKIERLLATEDHDTCSQSELLRLKSTRAQIVPESQCDPETCMPGRVHLIRGNHDRGLMPTRGRGGRPQAERSC